MSEQRLRLSVGEEFMRHFRWITPLLLSVGIWLVSQVVDALKEVRAELTALRRESMAYTDKMVGMAVSQQTEFKQEVRESFAEVKGLIRNGR